MSITEMSGKRPTCQYGPLINNNSKEATQCKEALSTKGFIFSINGSGSLISMWMKKIWPGFSLLLIVKCEKREIQLKKKLWSKTEPETKDMVNLSLSIILLKMLGSVYHSSHRRGWQSHPKETVQQPAQKRPGNRDEITPGETLPATGNKQWTKWRKASDCWDSTRQNNRADFPVNMPYPGLPGGTWW